MAAPEFRTEYPHLEAGRKSIPELIEGLYEHCSNKSITSRNMLNSLYQEDPLNFHKKEEVKHVLRNNIAWPQGYVPAVSKPTKMFHQSKEQIFRQGLKDKHQVFMKAVGGAAIDSLIQDA